MDYLFAMRAAFVAEWKVILRSRAFVSILVNSVPPAVLIGWIAGRAPDHRLVTTLALGAGLMIAWNYSVTRLGYSLDSELWNGVLEVALVSRTPLVLIMLGKALAIATYNLLGGLLALATALVVAKAFLDVEQPAALVPSLVVVLTALVIGGFFFAPLQVFVGAKAGFFNAIMPAGVVLAGFLYPPSTLPTGLEALARLTPTSWGMEAVRRSVQVGADWRVALDCGTCLLLGLMYLGVIAWLFTRVERRVRKSGTLSSY